MTPVFGDIELARRIERCEAHFIETVANAAHRRNGGAGFSLPIGGGVATHAEAGSPFNKVVGLGFESVPSEAMLEEVEERYAGVGAPVQVELSTLADPSLAATLTRRGYVLAGFEDVLGSSIGGENPAIPPGLEVRKSPEAEEDDWLEVIVEGFEAADEEGVPSQEEFPRDAIERAERDMAAAGVARYSALVDGELAGGGVLHAGSGIAYLAGAATAPRFRRRGVHGALLSARLAEAAALGCEVAVITTQPGSTAQRNVWRRGFELLYSRALLVRE